MNKKQLKKLRHKLYKGDITTIANNTGFSISYINKIFSGIYYNQDVIDEAIRIADNHQTVKRKQSSKIDTL